MYFYTYKFLYVSKIIIIYEYIMNCSNKYKKITGYFHLLSVIIISIFTILQIYMLEKGHKTEYWIPIAIIITIILHIPNIICMH